MIGATKAPRSDFVRQILVIQSEVRVIFLNVIPYLAPLKCTRFVSQFFCYHDIRRKVKNYPHFCFPIYLHKSRGSTNTSFFYIVSFLFDALGPAVHKLAYSFHEEGFRLVAQQFMHRFPPRRLVRIAGFRLLASKSL
jgi:hypothetical protein